MNTGIAESEYKILPAQTMVPRCFVCGMENPSGLRLRFFMEAPTRVCAFFTPPEDWTGWGTMLHGGFHGLLLDETMSWVVFGLMGERAFVTRSMTIKYRRPVYVNRPLKITGWLEEDKGKDIYTGGDIRDEAGEALTIASGIISRIDPEIMKNLL